MTLDSFPQSSADNLCKRFGFLASGDLSFADNLCKWFGLSSGLIGRVVQSVTCLTADTGVVSSISAQSHTFLEIAHEIISMAILFPSADFRRVVVNYKRKYWLTGKKCGKVI